MIVRILGAAAGGGVPQWNCACGNCAAVRAGRRAPLTQSTVAVSPGGARWLLLNCSPDIAAQIEGFAALHPPAPRGTPIADMLFTDANVDHLGGLTVLRQSGDHAFRLRSSAVVREIATAQPAFAPFAQHPHQWLDVPFDAPCATSSPGDLVGTGLVVRALAVPGTTPGYDGRRSLPGAVVAYQISDASGGATLLFAPVFSEISEQLERAIALSQTALLDGTFFSDDELPALQLSRKRARTLGHQPVGGPDGTLARLRGCRARLVFTHLNNSNPMLDPHSEAARAVASAGAEIAFDGMEFSV